MTARTALRLAIVQCLKGTADPRPTIAGARVYDSRISAEEADVFDEEAEPIVIVLTDEDEGDALSDQDGGPPFHRKISVVFDIGMVAREKADADPDGYVIGYPDTDARLEASIDTLQTQIVRQLFKVLDDPLALFIRRFVRVWKQESHRQVDDDAGVKLARRLWTLQCEIPDDDFDLILPGEATPAGLDVLPEPLRTVAKLMPVGSSGAEICAAIAAALAPITTTPFTGVDIVTDVADPPAGANADGTPTKQTSDQINSKADTGQQP